MLGKRSSQHRYSNDDSRPPAEAAGRFAGIARAAVVGFALLSSTQAVHAGTTGCTATVSEALISSLAPLAPNLSREVLRLALKATTCAQQQGYVRRNDLLTVIDYSLPSTQPRLFVFNVRERKLLFRELVAHGKNSGDNLTSRFSNAPGSLATSIGLFVTGDTYFGNNGYSLRLRGLEDGVNDRASERAIVMHGASYVSNTIVRSLGRLGRSWGCPAVRKEIARKMIDTLKGGTPIFAYYPDKGWLGHSTFLR